MSLRAAMPITAAWIDVLRVTFGADQIDPSIKLGMRGGAGFYACENGHELGRMNARQGVSLADMVLTPVSDETNAATARKSRRMAA